MLCVEEQYVSILSEIMSCKEKEKYLYLTGKTLCNFFHTVIKYISHLIVFCYLEILIHIQLSKADHLIEDREGYSIKT